MISFSCPRQISPNDTSSFSFSVLWQMKKFSTLCFSGRRPLDWLACTWKQRAPRFIASCNGIVITETKFLRFFSFSRRSLWQTRRLIYGDLCSYQNKLCIAPDWILKGFKNVIGVCSLKRFKSIRCLARFNFDVKERFNSPMRYFIFSIKETGFCLISRGEEQYGKLVKKFQYFLLLRSEGNAIFVLKLRRFFSDFLQSVNSSLLHVFSWKWLKMPSSYRSH